MTEEAKRCVEALQNSIHKGNEWVENPDFSMPCKGLIRLIESLSEQLERVTKERDAAVDKLRGKCAECINEYPGITHLEGSICENCVFNGDCYAQAEDHWEWRGAEVEGCRL